jgi:hypothetical protein
LRIRWNGTAFPGAPNASAYDPEAKIAVYEGSCRKLSVCRLVEDFIAVAVVYAGWMLIRLRCCCNSIGTGRKGAEFS